jgi:hypothetical protein
LKLNGTHQLRVEADDVNILGRYVHTIKKNTEALVVPNKESLEVNADTTKYTVMSRDQDAAQSHSVKIVNIYFERVEEFIWEQPKQIKILFR